MIKNLEESIDALRAILSVPLVRKDMHEYDLRDIDNAMLRIDLMVNRVESEIENMKSFILAKSAELMEYVND